MAVAIPGTFASEGLKRLQVSYCDLLKHNRRMGVAGGGRRAPFGPPEYRQCFNRRPAQAESLAFQVSL